ncbi:MAG: alpha/beta hydrolase, partial [Cyclobacteriaceae bacterium]
MLVTLITFITLLSCSTQSTDQDRPVKPPKGYMNETFLKIAYGMGMLDLIESEPPVPDEIQEIKNIEYKSVDNISLQLDIYKRKDLQTPAPTLIFIHGGAWRKGKRADYLPYLIDYAQKGYITATISYRLIKQAPYPAAVQDVSCGIKWIKANAAQYGIDPDRIALVGGSAGGHLALLIGYGGENPLFNEACDLEVDTKVKAIVDFY